MFPPKRFLINRKEGEGVKKPRSIVRIGMAVLVCLLVFLSTAEAESVLPLSTGQTLYVPAYSHIYSGNNEQPFLLTVTLSIRNIDPGRTILATKADYYATQGKQLKSYVTAPVQLKP